MIEPGRDLTLVEDDIYSVLPNTCKRHHYDTTAKFYDLFMSTRLYHSIMWGSSPSAYSSFSREAVDSNAEGIMLDAGCGTLLFTAELYIESDRKIICFGQSIGMLRKARGRLIELAGYVPENTTIVQADLSDLPFTPETFTAVLCLNVLHLYENVENLMKRFRSALAPEGKILITSLVRNERLIGDLYFDLLFIAREFAKPKTAAELSRLIEQSFGSTVSYRTEGNMAFASAKKVT